MNLLTCSCVSLCSRGTAQRCRVGDCELDLKPRGQLDLFRDRLIKSLTSPFERRSLRQPSSRRPVLHTIAVDELQPVDHPPAQRRAAPTGNAPAANAPTGNAPAANAADLLVDARLAALAVHSPRVSPRSSPRSSPRRARPLPLMLEAAAPRDALRRSMPLA